MLPERPEDDLSVDLFVYIGVTHCLRVVHLLYTNLFEDGEKNPPNPPSLGIFYSRCRFEVAPPSREADLE